MKLIFILLFWSIVVILLITRYIKSARTTEIRSQLELEFRSREFDLDDKSQSLSQKELDIAKHEQTIALQAQKLKSTESLLKAESDDLDAREASLRKEEYDLTQKEQDLSQREQTLKYLQSSSLTALPYMAAIIADFDTRGLEILACKLDWGNNYERAKKVTSIRVLRKETQRLLAESKVAEYQLAYAIKMFPSLEDFLETEYSQLPTVDFTDISSENHDAVRSYLTKEEYVQLSTTDRNQLALDRYRNSHRKSNWQVGRDYELYVGYKYSLKGYSIDYYGSTHGLEDLGRDLIAKKTGFPTLIIQCKYWSSKKTIHEKHINQLYGTMTCYCFENNIPLDSVRGVLVTNISISDTARRFSKYLGIEIVENFPLGEYPCIKCNINHDEYGAKTKIYHLPFDQQYDSCKIDKPGEFFAMTVAEAESAGFRRAFRWFSN